MRRRTLREATYCHYVIINMILTVLMLNERNVSVQIFLQLVLAIHGLFPLLEGRHLAYHASSDEAHGAVDWSVETSRIRGPREVAPQVLGPGDVSVPA